jgi:CheY-like chemotaxis protein
VTLATSNVDLHEPLAQERLSVPPGRYAALSVRDGGLGMSADVRAHIFEPFFTTKPRGRGTGLGLPTVYGIVKQSGGYIVVETAVGRGSTFRIYLPRVDAEAEQRAAAATAPVSYAGTETVLLVENEDAVRLFLREALQRNGYRVLEARHGGEALEVATRFLGPIDILVTDVVMPVMGGRELVDRLRERPGAPAVLYMSGYAESEIVHRGVLRDGSRLLEKPFTPAELLEAVRATLDEARRAR